MGDWGRLPQSLLRSAPVFSGSTRPQLLQVSAGRLFNPAILFPLVYPVHTSLQPTVIVLASMEVSASVAISANVNQVSMETLVKKVLLVDICCPFLHTVASCWLNPLILITPGDAKTRRLQKRCFTLIFSVVVIIYNNILRTWSALLR